MPLAGYWISVKAYRGNNKSLRVTYSRCLPRVFGVVWRVFAVESRLVANKTFSVAQAVGQIGAPSERWYIERLRSGYFPGRKIGRHWRMTEQDIIDALDICKNEGLTAAPTGITARSRKRVAQ